MRRRAAVLVLVAALVGGCSDDDDYSKFAFESSKFDDIRAATKRYRDIHVALGEGYVSGLVCAPGDLPPSKGAAGVHLGHYGLIRDRELDERKPEVLIYMPTETDYELVAAEYVLPDRGQLAPKLFDREFARFDATDTPGFRAALPPGEPPLAWFLHSWIYKRNPRGVFADSNPRLRCPPPGPPFEGPGPATGGAAAGTLPKSAGPSAGDFLHLSLQAGIGEAGPTGRFDINHLDDQTKGVVTKLHGVIKCVKVRGKTAFVSGVVTEGSVPANPQLEPAGESVAITVKDRGNNRYSFAIDLAFLPPRHEIRPCQPVSTDVVKVDGRKSGSFVVRSE